MKTFFWKNIFYISACIGLVILDLVTKLLAENFLIAPFSVIKGTFQLSLSHNTGVAFGIPIPNIIITGLIPFFIAFVIWLFHKNFNFIDSITKLSLTFILAGSLGNFINRLLIQSVTDFIAFSFWPSFNLADSYITIGFFLIFMFYGRIAGSKN